MSKQILKGRQKRLWICGILCHNWIGTIFSELNWRVKELHSLAFVPNPKVSVKVLYDMSMYTQSGQTVTVAVVGTKEAFETYEYYQFVPERIISDSATNAI